MPIAPFKGGGGMSKGTLLELLNNLQHNNLRGLQGGSASERYHMTAAQVTKLENAATASEIIKVHNSLQGLQGGSSTERYHLTAAQVSKLEGAAASGDIVKAHNSLQGLQGGNSTERYHLTAAQVSKLDNAPTSSDIIKAHNSLQGLQGGNENERYHLTEAQLNKVVNGGGSGQARLVTEVFCGLIGGGYVSGALGNHSPSYFAGKVPDGVYSMKVTMCGSGGGYKEGLTTNYSAGCGAWVIDVPVDVSPGDWLNVNAGMAIGYDKISKGNDSTFAVSRIENGTSYGNPYTSIVCPGGTSNSVGVGTAGAAARDLTPKITLNGNVIDSKMTIHQMFQAGNADGTALFNRWGKGNTTGSPDSRWHQGMVFLTFIKN